MACIDLTSGIGAPCKETQGGTEEIYLFKFLKNAFTVVDGVATAINPSILSAYQFFIKGDGHILAQNEVGSRDALTVVVTQTLTFMTSKINASKNETFKSVARGFMIAVVKDRNGSYHAVGLDDGIDFVVDSTTGSAKADFNGYTAVGTSTTFDKAPILDQPTIDALLAIAV